MAIQLESLVESIKSKVRALKKSKKKNKMYVKMDKSSSVKVEIRSRKAKKLIHQTLKAADRPGKSSLSWDGSITSVYSLSLSDVYVDWSS